MSITGKIIDWVEVLADLIDDPESRPAGYAEPHYAVSETVTISRDQGVYVYHLPDDQLGQGSSLGNARAWAETKGNGDMLSLFSIDAGTKVFGGLSVTYLLPFSNLSTYGKPMPKDSKDERDHFTRAMPSASGSIHLHPAYQQREFVIGDGLHILETFFLPCISEDDPAAAYEVVSFVNRTPHPIGITAVVSVGLRGQTDIDLHADYDSSRNAIIAWNESNPDWVRVFGSMDGLKGYWATTDQEGAYSPRKPLPSKTRECGDLTGALQFDLLILPGQHKKIKTALAFSAAGRKNALKAYDWAASHSRALKETIDYYQWILCDSIVEMPDDLLTQGVQWAKACLVRPISHYNVGLAVTNDPGRSNNLVTRDTAWYTHGCDFVNPQWSCEMLDVLSRHQRQDGLMPEYMNGNTGKTQDYDMNINDGTPLYVMAVAHHIKTTGHWNCLRHLYDSAHKATDHILKQRDENGLIKCTATGIGPKAFCGWRNVLENEQLTGVITEINAECYGALIAMADLAELRGYFGDAQRYRNHAEQLKSDINKHLINPDNGLYYLNIDLRGNRITQVTCDQIFPLIFGIAERETEKIVIARLAEHDFMTPGGIRVLPSENPQYDPAFQAGCMGGVWPGVTWWYAMSSAHSDPRIMAESLHNAYHHYLVDPKVYNTVPGQFSEWSDGQTLVNRGMRLSPWDSPRFLWAAIEGLAGIKVGLNGISLHPQIPSEWQWLRIHNVIYQDGKLSYFLTRESDGLHVYTPNRFGCEFEQHNYDEAIPGGAEIITTGICTTAYRKGSETLICLGNSLPQPAAGPFLTHHALDSGKRYQIQSLGSHLPHWENMGVRKGSELQRIIVRIEKQGYALYKFTEKE